MTAYQNKPDRGYAGRPTIAELDVILNGEDDRAVIINPEGTITINDIELDIAADMERELSQPEKENTMAYDDRLASGPLSYPGMDESALKNAAYQQQGYDKRYAGETVAPPEAPITRLARAVDRLSNAAAFASQTSDLLCGPVRIDGKGSPDAPAPDGLFAAMNMLAVQIDRHTDSIQASMERIHKIGG